MAPASGAVVQRAVAKASINYKNSSWDLVDAAKEKTFDFSKVKTEELPEPMQKMNTADRKAYVAKNARERADLQAKIAQLNADREKYVAEKAKELPGNNTLDTAMIAAVREQGAKRNFQFK